MTDKNSESKFKIGDYVKQNPVGVVKKVIAIEPPDSTNKFDNCYWYKLEDSFGWEPEFKLTLDKKENLSFSYDRAQELKIEKLQKTIDEQAERIKELNKTIEEFYRMFKKQDAKEAESLHKYMLLLAELRKANKAMDRIIKADKNLQSVDLYCFGRIAREYKSALPPEIKERLEKEGE